jgi:hypothetical protein
MYAERRRFGHLNEMRFSLRTLLVIVAISPLIIAGAIWWMDRDRAFTVELHFLQEPERKERVRLTIDSTAVEQPRRLGKNVYRIDIPPSGEAQIAWPVFRGWHRLVVVTPTRRITRPDFWIASERYESAVLTERLPGGGVQTRSVVDGSVYVLDFAFKE